MKRCYVFARIVNVLEVDYHHFFILPEDKVLLSDEKSSLKRYDDQDTKSKALTERYFCDQCGNHV